MTLNFGIFGLFALIEHEFKPLLLLLFLVINLLFNFVHLNQNILVFGKFIRLIQVVKSNLDIFGFPVDILKVRLCLFVINFRVVLVDFKGLFWSMNSLIFLIHFCESRADVEVESNQKGLMLVFVLRLWLVVFIDDILILEVFILSCMNEAEDRQSFLVLAQGFAKVL